MEAALKASEQIPLPELPAKAPGKPPKERYREQYGVLTTFKNEAEQKAAFDQLKGLGFKCKVLCT